MADHIHGYPKRQHQGWVLTDGSGKTIGHGHQIGCTKIPPGSRGSWISSERCSYRFKVGGKWYSGRGYGEGMSFSGRAMKRPPPYRNPTPGGRPGR